MSKTKIELPECGILVGNAIYNSYAGYLMGTCWVGSSWYSDSTAPLELLDLTIKENQGNLVQFWWFDGSSRPQMKARYLALEDLNITIPPPDFKTGKYTTLKEFDVFEKYGAERAGAGVLKALEYAKELGLYTNMIYCDGVNPAISAKFETLAPSYIGYDFGEKFSFRYTGGNSEQVQNVTLKSLADDLTGQIKAHIDERKALGYGNICCTSSNFFMDYEIAAGVDFTLFEDCTMEINIASALSRGLCKQFDLGIWGGHIANEYYGWIPGKNQFRYITLRTEMYMKYMAGSKIIVVESGAWHCQSMGNGFPQNKTPHVQRPIAPSTDDMWMPLEQEAEKYFPELDRNCEHSRNYRKIVSGFYDFVKENGTPSGQPEVTAAIAKGNLDLSGYGLDGYDHTQAIAGAYELADRNPRWHADMPERGWEIASKVFFPREHDILDIEHYNRLFSGTPWGQTDVVSFINDSITSDFLVKNYKVLLFCGWNTCSEKQYDTLTDYVKRGGKLFIAIPHFSTDINRHFDDYTAHDLVHDGDLSELCGVKVKGPGVRFYWGSVPASCKESFLEEHRGFGAFSGKLGNIEITDPAMETLLFDNESFEPLLLRRKLEKGEVYFLNSWYYPGTYARNFGTFQKPDDVGMIGEIYRALAKSARSEVYITGIGKNSPDRECNYVNYSYFPESDTICLLNVDFTKPHTVELHRFGKSETVTLAAQEFRLIKNAREK